MCGGGVENMTEKTEKTEKTQKIQNNINFLREQLNDIEKQLIGIDEPEKLLELRLSEQKLRFKIRKLYDTLIEENPDSEIFCINHPEQSSTNICDVCGLPLCDLATCGINTKENHFCGLVCYGHFEKTEEIEETELFTIEEVKIPDDEEINSSLKEKETEPFIIEDVEIPNEEITSPLEETETIESPVEKPIETPLKFPIETILLDEKEEEEKKRYFFHSLWSDFVFPYKIIGKVLHPLASNRYGNTLALIIILLITLLTLSSLYIYQNYDYISVHYSINYYLSYIFSNWIYPFIFIWTFIGLWAIIRLIMRNTNNEQILIKFIIWLIIFVSIGYLSYIKFTNNPLTKPSLLAKIKDAPQLMPTYLWNAGEIENPNTLSPLTLLLETLEKDNYIDRYAIQSLLGDSFVYVGKVYSENYLAEPYISAFAGNYNGQPSKFYAFVPIGEESANLLPSNLLPVISDTLSPKLTLIPLINKLIYYKSTQDPILKEWIVWLYNNAYNIHLAPDKLVLHSNSELDSTLTDDYLISITYDGELPDAKVLQTHLIWNYEDNIKLTEEELEILNEFFNNTNLKPNYNRSINQLTDNQYEELAYACCIENKRRYYKRKQMNKLSPFYWDDKANSITPENSYIIETYAPVKTEATGDTLLIPLAIAGENSILIPEELLRPSANLNIACTYIIPPPPKRKYTELADTVNINITLPVSILRDELISVWSKKASESLSTIKLYEQPYPDLSLKVNAISPFLRELSNEIPYKNAKREIVLEALLAFSQQFYITSQRTQQIYNKRYSVWEEEANLNPRGPLSTLINGGDRNEVNILYASLVTAYGYPAILTYIANIRTKEIFPNIGVLGEFSGVGVSYQNKHFTLADPSLKGSHIGLETAHRDPNFKALHILQVGLRRN